MALNGYIYVITNPSMPNLVKVGRTEKEPELRIKELTNNTAVPTPFVLAYDAFFYDCGKAEKYVHQELEEQGYRLSKNREFFTAPLNAVIKIVIGAQSSEQNSSLTLDSKDAQSKPIKFESVPSLEIILKKAYDHYYQWKDYKKALKYFKEAISLGAKDECLVVGEMYEYGEGGEEDEQSAITYYKKGADRGDGRCWAELARVYRYKDQIKQSDYWRQYFESKSFLEDKKNENQYLKSRIDYSLDYICYAARNNTRIDFERTLKPLKSELLQLCKNNLFNHSTSDYGIQLWYERGLRAIEKL